MEKPYSDDLHKKAIEADSLYRRDRNSFLFGGLLVVCFTVALCIWLMQPGVIERCVAKGGSWMPVVTQYSESGKPKATFKGCIMPAALKTVEAMTKNRLSEATETPKTISAGGVTVSVSQ